MGVIWEEEWVGICGYLVGKEVLLVRGSFIVVIRIIKLRVFRLVVNYLIGDNIDWFWIKSVRGSGGS